MIITKEIDCSCTAEIVCPYCGYESGDSWECSDDGEITCSDCSKKFNYVRNTSVNYSSSKIDCGDGKHDYQFHKPFLDNKESRDRVWIYQPEDKWEYNELQKCTKCDDVIYTVKISKEEFLKKYPDYYEMCYKWFKENR